MDASDERRAREEMAVDLDTSDLIIGITQVFNKELSYTTAMNRMLEMVSRVLNPERLIVFERGETTTRCTFEWHAEGVPSVKERLQNLPNAQFDTMAELRDEEILKHHPDVVVSDVDRLKSLDGRLYRQLGQEGIQRMMAARLLHDGKIIGYLSANNFKLQEGLDAKRVLDTVATFVSARMANQHLLSELARMGTHDRLTGLLNRWGIDAAINAHLEENPAAPYVLALIDIDDFKTVNDRFGHDVGDAALVALANQIQRAFPPSAVIGRNGGDEFLVMLFGDDADQADETIQAFSQEETSCELHDQRFGFSASVGYVRFPEQASGLRDAYAKADDALYAVKLAGKAGMVRYTPAIDRTHRSHLGFTARDVAENIPAGVVVYRVGDTHEILFANRMFMDLLGYEGYDDLMNGTGGTFERVVHPDDAGLVLRGVPGSVQPGAGVPKGVNECRIITKSGEERRVVGMSRMSHVHRLGDVCYVFLTDEA